MNNLSAEDVDAIVQAIESSSSVPPKRGRPARRESRDVVALEESAPKRAVARAAFVSMKDEPRAAESSDRGEPLEFKVEAEVWLGRAKMPLRRLAHLEEESLLVLDEGEGERVDVRVEGVLVARGEIVVVDGYYGVRLVEIFIQ